MPISDLDENTSRVAYLSSLTKSFINPDKNLKEASLMVVISYLLYLSKLQTINYVVGIPYNGGVICSEPKTNMVTNKPNTG